jgi:phosphopantetheinyl transferase
MFKLDKISNSITIARLDLAAFSAEQSIEQKREIETQGTRLLLNKLFEGSPVELKYTENKKPYLEGQNTHISISHSHDKLVIIANTTQSTGIDIELIRDKVRNIQHKFLNEQELVFAKEDVETLTTLWAAKEAIYKAYGLKEVDFKKHICIEPYDKCENNFFGKIDLPNFKKRYLLNKQKQDNYILVYILSEV